MMSLALTRAVVMLTEAMQSNPEALRKMYARALEDERDGIDRSGLLDEADTIRYRQSLRQAWLDSEEGLCPRSISA